MLNEHVKHKDDWLLSKSRFNFLNQKNNLKKMTLCRKGQCYSMF